MAQLRQTMEHYTEKVFGVSPSTWTDFEYHAESTNTSNTLISTNIVIPLVVVTLYCIGIPLLQLFMRNREPLNVRPILFIHNIILSLLSLYLTLFMGSTVLSYGSLNNKSYYDMFCTFTRDDQRGTLNWLYYINLLTKYYELTDTVFLVIKKKPVTFLHGYHHPATLVFAWIIIMESPGMEWTVLILNLLVHTIMYFYYAMSAIKIRMPGKQIITILQIVQFVLDLAFVWYNMWEINFGARACQATNVAGYTATFILGSYLLLFLDFFKSAYCPSKPKKIANGSKANKMSKDGVNNKNNNKTDEEHKHESEMKQETKKNQ